MAGEFLRSHGIDIDAEMARIQFGDVDQATDGDVSLSIRSVTLPGREAQKTWDVTITDGHIKELVKSDGNINIQNIEETCDQVDGCGALLAPSLCHPHIHIDKAYLLAHPKYANLQIEQGDFKEAMALTGKAKAQFEEDDLLERGQRVIDESIAAGVTHMRAFVEVDAGVRTKCLDAGLSLKRKAATEKTCIVQICAFAQLPLFSSSQDDEKGEVIRDLMQNAARTEAVEAIGSTPYVETDRQKMERNVDWMVDLSIESNLHLDFHLDYNLDADVEPLIWYVIEALQTKQWKERTTNKTIIFGHCTRLTLFDDETWHKLAEKITKADLPISFVGLPTSDLFMMRSGRQPEIRGTLDIVTLIKKHGLNACIGINNIGNAFTPQGSCDPLSLASQCIGIYQAGTKQDAELLYSCVSTRAKAAIGYGRRNSSDFDLRLKEEDPADLVLFGSHQAEWRTRKSVSESVYLRDECGGRRTLCGGTVVR